MLNHHFINHQITDDHSNQLRLILITSSQIHFIQAKKIMAFCLVSIQYAFSQVSKLVIVRHGQSVWNKQKRWTGWSDVRLSSAGINEAKQCGKLLKQHNFIFDEAYSSVLTRSVQTLNHMLDQLDAHYIPVHKSWRLNQKHYGTLTGLSKVQVTQQYGEQKVAEWRRSFSIPPPPVDINDERHPSRDRRYAQIDKKQVTCSQSLSDVIKRLYSLWNTELAQKLMMGKNLLMSAHGGSARGLAKIITDLPETQIMELNLPHTTPLVFSFENTKDQLVFKNMEYIGNLEEINIKMLNIKNENKPPAV